MIAARARSTRTALAAIALLGVCGRAMSQAPAPADDGPIIVGEEVGKYKWWDLQSVSLDLELFAEFRKDKLSQKGQPTQELRDDRIRGTTNLTFESYIGHKNLIDLTGLVKLGYEDETIGSSFPDSSVHQTPFTNLYDVRALVLGNSKTPLTLYSTRDETVTGRDFLGSLRTTTTEHGAILTIDEEKIPTRFQYFHRDQDQSDPIGTQNYSAAQNTFTAQSSARLSDSQKIELSYEFDHVDENQQPLPQNSYDRQDGTLTHYWYFGSEGRSNLRSNLRYLDQTGRYNQSLLRLDEQAVAYHNDHLETRYNFAVEDQTRGSADQRLITGNAQIRHKLFQSLVSSATAGGSSFEIPGEFDSTEFFTSGTLDYTKKVPFGVFTASAGLGVNHQDNSERGTNIFVLNESRTFVDPLDLVLSRRNIIPSSIRITDLTQLQTYVAGVDFTVDASIAEVRLRRVLTGAITNGQSVLISYQIGPEPGSTIDTFTQTYSARYAINEGWLDGLEFYTLIQVSDHSISAADLAQFVLDDFTDIRYGLEYHIGDFRFLGEMQNRESTVSPYDRLRLEVHYDRRAGRTTTLTAEYAHEELDYKMPSNSVVFDRVQGRWTERIGTGLDLSLYLQYRNERNERDGDTQGFEQGVELNWRYRQTRFYTSFKNALLNGDSFDQTSQTFTVGFLRTF